MFPEDSKQSKRREGPAELVSSVEFYWKLKGQICIFSMTPLIKTAKPTVKGVVYMAFVFICLIVKLIIEKYDYIYQVAELIFPLHF